MRGKGSRSLSILLALGALLVLVDLAALRIGQVEVSWSEIWRLLTGGEGVPEGSRRIVLGLRLPRILLGTAVGASLASSGTVFQALLRNPLADPYLLGLSGGAALGAAIVILGGMAGVHPLLLPAAAFLGALLALLAVTRMAAASRQPGSATIILAGVMVSAFCSALVMLLNSLSPSGRVHGTLLWMMGSLASPPPGILAPLLGAAVAGVLYLTLSGHHLNVLSLGEETARQIGIDAVAARNRFLVAASLITGLSVAASGLVGFIGLVVPHVLRNFFGADHRFLVPASALAGGAVLVLADSGARSLLPPAEIPVGVITALVGAPFFLFLLRRRQGWMQ
jgi:iron complex transport system permease protein